MSIKSLSDEELKKIADDIYRGLIFTSGHVQNPRDLGSVFIPLLFGDESQLKGLEHAGMLYEYMSEALPRSINGMPCFSSMRLLNKKDGLKVGEYYKKIKESIDSIK